MSEKTGTVCSECECEFIDGVCDCIPEMLVTNLQGERAKNAFLEKQLENIQSITQDEFYGN